MPPKATPERVSAFSDGVFAILITVLVLELRPPEQPTFKALVQLWPTWISYAVSYQFIATVWANHLPGEHDVSASDLGADRRRRVSPAEGTQGHVFQVHHDSLLLRNRSLRRVELSAGRARNLYCLPGGLSEA